MASGIGARGLPVLTKDTRIRYTPAELGALRRADVRLFVLISGNLKSEQMAEAFVRAMPVILGTRVSATRRR